MNKILLFPVFIMLLISLFAVTIGTIENPSDYSPTGEGGIIAIDEDGLYVFIYENETVGFFTDLTGYYPYNPLSLPDDGFRLETLDMGRLTYTDMDDFNADWGTTGASFDSNTVYDVMDTKLFWGILVGILASGVALGVRVFGTGLSEFAQRTAFLSLGWGAIWAYVSITTYDLLLIGALGIFGTLLYVGLTLCFIVGVISEVTNGGD